MRVVWKKGFDQSKVTDNNYISLTQFEYAVFFEENYEEEIASGIHHFLIWSTLWSLRFALYRVLKKYSQFLTLSFPFAEVWSKMIK